MIIICFTNCITAGCLKCDSNLLFFPHLDKGLIFNICQNIFRKNNNGNVILRIKKTRIANNKIKCDATTFSLLQANVLLWHSCVKCKLWTTNYALSGFLSLHQWSFKKLKCAKLEFLPSVPHASDSIEPKWGLHAVSLHILFSAMRLFLFLTCLPVIFTLGLWSASLSTPHMQHVGNSLGFSCRRTVG